MRRYVPRGTLGGVWTRLLWRLLGDDIEECADCAHHGFDHRHRGHRPCQLCDCSAFLPELTVRR